MSEPCDPGQYIDNDSGCQDCLVDTYSRGEFVTSCTSCPSGKTVSSGSGTNIEDCEWSEFNFEKSSSKLYLFYNLRLIAHELRCKVAMQISVSSFISASTLP